MVPSVGDDCGAAAPSAGGERDTIEQLLDYDRDERSDECDVARRFELVAEEKDGVDLSRSLPEDTDTDEEQHDADDGRGQGLILAVAVVVILVPGAGRETEAEEDDEVRGEVRERMHRVGHHGATMPAYTGGEFEEE